MSSYENVFSLQVKIFVAQAEEQEHLPSFNILRLVILDYSTKHDRQDVSSIVHSKISVMAAVPDKVRGRTSSSGGGPARRI